uniref:Zinc finger PMZ-type domain-containing protein n=1 Tax=Brassica oleracea var. oleracea TaxID=109376 RepID=A0A0D3C3D7_BRAOL
MHIYASCGVWKFDPCKGWGFAFDKEKGGRVLAVELTSSFEDLRTTAFENFRIDQNDVELELTYLPMELINTIDCSPVIIENDRQVKNFLTYVRGKASSRLCVSSSPVNANNDNIELDKEQSNASGRERGEPSSFSPGDGIGSSCESSKDGEDECNSNAPEDDEDDDLSVKEEDKGKSVRFSLKDVVKRDRKLWYIRCVDNKCRWSVRAEGLSGSTYFIIKKYVADHTCAASSMNNGGRTASAKTIGSLIMHRYDGVKEGPKANDIIQIMRMEHGCEISKSLAWDAREYAISLKRFKAMCNISPAIGKYLRDADVTKWACYQFQGYRRTFSCGKYDLLKIPCRHAIKAGLTVGRAPSSLTDFMFTTSNWRTAYEETINPIGIPEDSWVVPDTVQNASVLAPESRR